MWLGLNEKVNGNVNGDVIRDLDGNVDRNEKKVNGMWMEM